jgi:hypothetical protein
MGLPEQFHSNPGSEILSQQEITIPGEEENFTAGGKFTQRGDHLLVVIGRIIIAQPDLEQVAEDIEVPGGGCA